MRILVTGGAGFIGSHLVDALVSANHEVFIIDNFRSGQREHVNPKATLIERDVCDLANMTDLPEKFDVVYHLAAQIDVRHSVSQPAEDAHINILGAIAVLEFAQKTGAKVVFSSSGGAIYGSTRSYPTPEHVAPRPASPYGLAKYCAERYIKLFHKLHKIPYVILRYGNVYGPRQNGSKETGVIAIFCDKAMKGEPLTIFGNGKQTRDFVYVGDVVKANLLAAEKSEGVYNIGSGTEISINDLAALVLRAAGKSAEVKHARGKKGEVKRSCLSIEKARAGLGWAPSLTLEQGIAQTLQAMKT